MSGAGPGVRVRGPPDGPAREGRGPAGGPKGQLPATRTLFTSTTKSPCAVAKRPVHAHLLITAVIDDNPVVVIRC